MQHCFLSYHDAASSIQLCCAKHSRAYKTGSPENIQLADVDLCAKLPTTSMDDILYGMAAAQASSLCISACTRHKVV